MDFPFLYIAISYTTGIIFGNYLPLPIYILNVSLIISFVFSWIAFLLKKHKFTFLFILFCTFLIGDLSTQRKNNEWEKNFLNNLDTDEYIDLYGYAYKTPELTDQGKYIFMKLEKIWFDKKEIPSYGKVRIKIRSEEINFPEINMGDRIKVSAKLSHFYSYKNFKSSSSRIFFKINQINRIAYSKSQNLIEIIEKNRKFNLLNTISQIREFLLKKIDESATRDHKYLKEASFLKAILLGEREGLPKEILDSTQNSGLFHLLAISGAHIGIISFFIFRFLRLFINSEKLNYIILIFFLIFYSVLVEGRASVIRASLMAISFSIGKILYKDINYINILSFSYVLILAINPFFLFDIGFQLTYTATLSLILLAPRFLKYLPALPFKISELTSISLAAQIGVLPIIAYYFNRVTLISVFLNLLAVPLAGIILGLSFIILPIYLIFPFLKFLMISIFYLIDIFLLISDFSYKTPFLSYRIPGPNILLMIIYYIFLTILLTKLNKKLKIIFLTSFLFSLFLILAYPFPSYSKYMSISFIDVGQGESILVEFPGYKKMLIDGGGTFNDNFDIGERVVSPFLWSKGIKKINYVVSTHAHSDHLKGLITVIKNFKYGEIWESTSPKNEFLYKKFIKLLKNKPKKINRGYKTKINNVEIEIIHPPRKKDPEKALNEDSMVIKLSYRKISFLLTADIDMVSEMDIIKSGTNIKVNVLKAPHHGAKSSSSEEFLEKVKPEIVVICVGYKNSFGFPDQEIIDRYRIRKINVLRTDYNGLIEIKTDGNKLMVKKMID
ncbi:MAG: DNA internalization-related competence protein ComEC/Rec2 [Acidobacteriota bacterium]